MVETMKREGHKAIVHTAAASNLGQMLSKLCAKEGIPLVNIVRSAEQEKILRDIGAKHICNSTAPTFQEDTDVCIAPGVALIVAAFALGLWWTAT